MLGDVVPGPCFADGVALVTGVFGAEQLRESFHCGGVVEADDGDQLVFGEVHAGLWGDGLLEGLYEQALGVEHQPVHVEDRILEFYGNTSLCIICSIMSSNIFPAKLQGKDLFNFAAESYQVEWGWVLYREPSDFEKGD